MIKMIKNLSVVVMGLLAMSLLTSCAPKNNDTIIYLVRHAEKITGPDVGRDPQLNPAGKARAQILAELMRGKNLTHIYSSDTIRTRDTAAPTAEMTGIKTGIYNPRHLQELADTITSTKGRHLVVGHSNTIPATVAALGGDGGTPIFEKSEYDRLYIVTLTGDGNIATDLQRYGVRYKAED